MSHFRFPKKKGRNKISPFTPKAESPPLAQRKNKEKTRTTEVAPTTTAAPAVDAWVSSESVPALRLSLSLTKATVTHQRSYSGRNVSCSSWRKLNRRNRVEVQHRKSHRRKSLLPKTGKSQRGSQVSNATIPRLRPCLRMTMMLCSNLASNVLGVETHLASASCLCRTSNELFHSSRSSSLHGRNSTAWFRTSVPKMKPTISTPALGASPSCLSARKASAASPSLARSGASNFAIPTWWSLSRGSPTARRCQVLSVLCSAVTRLSTVGASPSWRTQRYSTCTTC